MEGARKFGKRCGEIRDEKGGKGSEKEFDASWGKPKSSNDRDHDGLIGELGKERSGRRDGDRAKCQERGGGGSSRFRNFNSYYKSRQSWRSWTSQKK